MELGEKSWDGLWSELLGTDFETNYIPENVPAGGNSASNYNVEADIENWAGQNFGLVLQNTPESSDRLQESTLSTEPPPSEVVCYGMVSNSLIQLQLF